MFQRPSIRNASGPLLRLMMTWAPGTRFVTVISLSQARNALGISGRGSFSFALPGNPSSAGTSQRGTFHTASDLLHLQNIAIVSGRRKVYVCGSMSCGVRPALYAVGKDFHPGTRNRRRYLEALSALIHNALQMYKC